MIMINPRAELSAFTARRDAAAFGGTTTLGAAEDLVKTAEVVDDFATIDPRFGGTPHDSAVLTAATDSTVLKTYRRENRAHDRIRRFYRCWDNCVMRDGPAAGDAIFVPSSSIDDWKRFSPFNASKSSGPFSAWWTWIAGEVSKSSYARLRGYFYAILLKEALESETPSELAEYGIPSDAIARIKPGLAKLQALRASLQAMTASEEYRSDSRANQRARVAPIISEITALPSIVKILRADVQLLSEADRRRFDGRMKFASKYPGVPSAAGGTVESASAIAASMKSAIVAARKARVQLWVDAYKSSVEVDLVVPSLTP